MKTTDYQVWASLPFEKAIAKKDVFIERYNRINNMYDSTVNTLMQNWKGAGANAFYDDAKTVKANITGIFDTMKIMCDTLVDILAIIKELDQKLGWANGGGNNYGGSTSGTNIDENIKKQDAFNKGISQPRSEACVYSSKANILNRKKMLDTGKSTDLITAEQVGRTFDNFQQPDCLPDNPYTKEYQPGMYQNYNGTVVDGFNYSFTYEQGNLSNARMVQILDEHPEGVVIRSNSLNHAITITDYDIKPDGSIQFYGMDPAVATGYSNDRIRIEDTFYFKNRSGSQNSEGFFNQFDQLVYISGRTA